MTKDWRKATMHPISAPPVQEQPVLCGGRKTNCISPRPSDAQPGGSTAQDHEFRTSEHEGMEGASRLSMVLGDWMCWYSVIRPPDSRREGRECAPRPGGCQASPPQS